MNIGNIEIKNKIVLAPMAGISNAAYIKICEEMGVGYAITELLSSEAIIRNSKKTFDMLKGIDTINIPIAIQIFGSKPETMAKSAKIINQMFPKAIIDINMGCPVPKVAIKSQSGAALLKQPELVKEIVSAVVSAVPVPVTVKIRSGWDKESINAVEIAKICEKSGAKAITIHARTRSQLYSGEPDLDIIKKIKENVNIPVIGNGNIKDIQSAIKMLEYTKCDAIMLGRALQGNPWLIKKINTYLTTGITIEEPTYKERILMCKKHLNNLIKFKNEKVAVLEMRNHISWYIKGMPYHKEIQNQYFKAQTKEEITEILDNYLKRLYN